MKKKLYEKPEFEEINYKADDVLSKSNPLWGEEDETPLIGP